MQLTKHWATALDDYVIDLAWSPDGTQLAAASAAGPLTLHQAADGTRRHTLPGHEEGTNALGWSPDGSILASGGQDSAVKFWDPQVGQHTATAKFERDWVDRLAWRPMPAAAATTSSPSSAASPFRPLLAAAAGRVLRFLNPDGTLAHSCEPAPKTLSALVWEPRGGAVATAFFGGVRLWDADDFIPQKTFAYANGIQALTWSPDGKWLVSGNQDPSVHLWIPENDFEFHMSGYESKVKDLAFDHTARWLATGGGREACLWDCRGDGPEGREPTMLPHDAKICALAFQNQHGLLASASEDGVLMLWSPERSQPMRATVRMPSAATRILWSPDDRFIAVGTAQGTVYVLKCEN